MNRIVPWHFLLAAVVLAMLPFVFQAVMVTRAGPAVASVEGAEEPESLPPALSLGPDWWEVMECETHDLDTWTNAKLAVPHIHQWLVDRDLRLNNCDALEVTYHRQAKLKSQQAPPITPDEISRGKAGTARFLEQYGDLKLASPDPKAWRRYVRIVQFDGAYNRIVVEMRLVRPGRGPVDVASWIRENKLERPVR